VTMNNAVFWDRKFHVRFEVFNWYFFAAYVGC
jgi:hypothetical protein